LKPYLVDDNFFNLINNKLVPFWNTAKFFASKYANFFLLYALKSNRQIPKISQSFFEKCIRQVTHGIEQSGGRTATSTAHTDHDKDSHILVLEEFHRSLNKESSNLLTKHDITNRDCLAPLVHELAREMETESKNHLKKAFLSRVKNFIKFNNQDKTNKENFSQYLEQKKTYKWHKKKSETEREDSRKIM